MDNPTLRAWQHILETELHDYLANKYPGEIATYDRFRKSTGPHCAYCKSAAKLVFKFEAVARPDFLDRFKENRWDGYK